MHIPQGQAQQGGGDTGAGEVDLVGVGAGAAHVGLHLVGDALGGGADLQQVVDLLVGDGGIADDRTLAQLYGAGVFGTGAGIIAGEGYVHGNGHIGLHCRACPVGTTHGGLLAHGGGGVDADLTAFFLGQLQGFQNNKGTAAVVHSPGREVAVEHFLMISVQMDRITLLDVLAGIGSILCADVDVQVAVLQFCLVHILVVDHGTVKGTGIAMDHHLMTGIGPGVDAAGLGYPQQTILLNVGDDEADLVDMGCQHYLEGRVGVQNADDVAGVIGADLVAMGLHLGDDLLLQADLMAGNGHTVQQGIQEFFVHGGSSYVSTAFIIDCGGEKSSGLRSAARLGNYSSSSLGL